MAEMSGKVIRYNLETEIKHGIQVSNLAYAVGMELGLPKGKCYDLAVAGLLHDIGKLRLTRYVSGREKPSGHRRNKVCTQTHAVGLRSF